MGWHFDVAIASSVYFHLTFIYLVLSWCFSDGKVDDIFLCFPYFIRLVRC